MGAVPNRVQVSRYYAEYLRPMRRHDVRTPHVTEGFSRIVSVPILPRCASSLVQKRIQTYPLLSILTSRSMIERAMTTLIPRQFYSQEELDKLYPKELELQLVQIVSTNNIASPCATAD